MCKVSHQMLVCRDVKVGDVDLNAPGVSVKELTKEASLSLKSILFCTYRSCLHWLIMEMWQFVFFFFFLFFLLLLLLLCKATHVFLTNIEVFIKSKGPRI